LIRCIQAEADSRYPQTMGTYKQWGHQDNTVLKIMRKSTQGRQEAGAQGKGKPQARFLF
jgi:hypothetical protein